MYKGGYTHYFAIDFSAHPEPSPVQKVIMEVTEEPIQPALLDSSRNLQPDLAPCSGQGPPVMRKKNKKTKPKEQERAEQSNV